MLLITIPKNLRTYLQVQKTSKKVVSPTGGTLVTNLEIDEEIFVRVKPDGGAGTTFLQDHDLIKEGVSPIRAKGFKNNQSTHVVVRLDKIFIKVFLKKSVS